MEYVVKVVVSALVIVSVSELGKRSTTVAALIASLPLTSILALIWLYRDSKDSQRVAELSMGILWAVIPSLLFFVMLAQLLQRGVRFPWAMAVSCLGMFLAYTAYAAVLSKMGVKF